MLILRQMIQLITQAEAFVSKRAFLLCPLISILNKLWFISASPEDLNQHSLPAALSQEGSCPSFPEDVNCAVAENMAGVNMDAFQTWTALEKIDEIVEDAIGSPLVTLSSALSLQ